MNVLIIGLGITARRVALELCERGHEVSVLSSSHDHINKLLSLGFSGQISQGVHIDRECLVAAGVESCDVLISATSDDNTNIMVAQIAKEFFKVPRVVTRVRDADREAIYQEFDIDTICPTTIISNSIVSAVLSDGEERRTLQFSTCTLEIETMYVTDLLDGRYADELRLGAGQSVLGVQHSDNRVTFTGAGSNRVLLCEGERVLIGRVVD